MPAATNATSVIPSDRRARLLFLFCLLSVLAILFHKSFDPDQVLFSNDGPLGAVRSQAGYMWGNLLAVWQDLNWVGTQSPSAPLDVSGLLLALCCDSLPDFGPAIFAKIYEPIGVMVLGLSAWLLFRQLRFRPWVCALGGLAAALNTMAFSVACWGLAEWPLAWAMNMLAVAALVAPSIRNWTVKAALAGLAVGMGVMEGFDVGAIFSLFTGAFAFLWVIATQGATGRALTRGFAVVAIMAVSAVLIAAQTVTGLIGTQVKGVVGMAQDEATKQPFRVGLLRRRSGCGHCRIRCRTVLPKEGKCILIRRTEAIMVLARAFDRRAAVELGAARSLLPIRLRAPVPVNHPQPV